MLGIPITTVAGTLLGMLAPWLLLALLVLLWVLPRSRARHAGLQAIGLGDGRIRNFKVRNQLVRARIPATQAAIGGEIQLETNCADLPRFAVVRLRRVDRLARKLRLAPRVRSGDRRVDRQLLINTDYRELPNALFATEGFTESVVALFEAGAQELRIEQGRASARFPSSAALTAGQPSVRLAQWAILLARIPGQLPALSGVLTPVTPLWPLRRALLIGACLCLPVLAALEYARAHDAFLPLDMPGLVRRSLLLWIPAGAALLFAGARLIGGHPTSGRLLPALLAATVLAVPPGMVTIALRWNAGEGVLAPTTQLLPVTARYRHFGFDRPGYRWSSSGLQRLSLTGARLPIVTNVRPLMWSTPDLDEARIRVMLVPGRLGIPWIADTAPVLAASTPAVRRQIARLPTPPPPPAMPPREAPRFGPKPRIAAQLAPESGSGPALLAQALEQFQAGKLKAARELLDRSIIDLDAAEAEPTTLAAAHWYRACLYSALGNAFDHQRTADIEAVLALLPGRDVALAKTLTSPVQGLGRYETALAFWDRYLAPQLPERPRDRSNTEVATVLAKPALSPIAAAH